MKLITFYHYGYLNQLYKFIDNKISTSKIQRVKFAFNFEWKNLIDFSTAVKGRISKNS